MVGKKTPPSVVPQPREEPFDEEEVADAQLADQPGDKEMKEAIEEDNSVPMVIYTGEFGAREITVQDWALARVAEQPAVRWDRTNNKSLPQSAFTEHALRVLRQDGNFRFTS